MRLTPLRRSGLLGAATVAAVATLALVTTAFAAPDKPVLNSGDERAVAYDKNVAPGHDDVCTVGGLTGTVVAKGKLTFTGGGEQDQYLNITAVDAGVTVTGVVVKGSDAFNVYLAAKLGPLPWNKLRSPENNGGNVPTISHWYACGVKKDQTSSSSSSSTSPSTITHTAPPSSSETTTSSSSEVAATTTTTAAGAPGSNDLASTGFGSAWLVGLGAALLAAGVAVLFVLRRRRA
ncbi:LPXTG cell wall anchor domain-containing protein [Lentzea rhizosphaerae]|uniref:LPXTG cell wall anchor domain-containing protein n=1 Tax=Lentzea rhizosphaerae TaxID=2041025 RepID=A0ABV8C4N8_9PSEU